MSDSKPPVLLTTKEAAARLRMSHETLRVWRRDGRGPEWVRIGPWKIFYDLAEIERFEREGVNR
jgi:hypothetical protein